MPSAANKTIQGLWIGPELSLMEQLSIASFRHHGHDYHLYVYEQVANVPEGTVIRDAREILPASRIFQYQGSPSYAGFANFFRYHLLYERGGWWADSDLICLQPFEFADEYVFSTEVSPQGAQTVNVGAIKAPAGSGLMRYAAQLCDSANAARLLWGETGPKLMQKAVRRFSLDRYQRPAQAFCPIDYEKWRTLLQPGFARTFDRGTFAIHLWNEMWRRAGQDKNAAYAPTCLYEILKRTYLPVAMAPAGPSELSRAIARATAEV